nr:acetyl transferase 1 [Phlegmariurus tetrastichus]
MGIRKLVEVLSVSTIVPAIPTPPTDRYFLSNLDQVFSGQWYMNTIYYFHPPEASTATQNLATSLKESLSRTLVHYPALAGRVKGGEDGRLEVDLNDEGVPVKEASVDAKLDDWEDIKDCPFELELNTEDTTISDYSASPLLRIQINIFRCGGIALGFSWAHAIADGWAATEFMKAWSQVHQRIAISNPPSFASSILRARSPPRITHPNKDYISTHRSPNSASVNNQIPEAAEPSYQTSVVRLSARQVEEMVAEVESGPWKYGRVSTFVAVAAFTWKVMTEARDLPDGAITKYVYPISCRQRWDPRLPAAYFGNAAHMSCLPHDAGAIKSNHISYTAKLIHDDIARTDTEYLQSAMDWLQVELEQGKDVGFSCDYYSGTDVQSTDFVHFPIYETDFGWGNPFYFSFPIQPLFGDGLALVLPAAEGGKSRCVPISMRQEHMKRMFKNELFLKFLPHLQQ